MLARFVAAVAAMVAVVAASNFLVQFPVQATFGGINLGDLLTWGAFTYPVAFLVNDLTNRTLGPQRARMVVLSGFVVAVVISIFLATPRIAIASGTAFLMAQLLDVSIFDRLRRGAWWQAPLVSTFLGSVLDTVVFFGISFAPSFAGIDAMFGMEDGSLGFPAPFLGIGPEVPLWMSLAVGDFIVKLLVAALLLAPYKVLRGMMSDRYVAA
ncbi:queuosine precursor transporter [Devosia sp.]|uniref:queuosine precursor transporter n=1 Tax=Devosia sp. TaxID=1871048 RepID=UPI003A922D04